MSIYGHLGHERGTLVADWIILKMLNMNMLWDFEVPGTLFAIIVCHENITQNSSRLPE
ncbi:hypothetical protein OAG77_00435 [bacterium]|nr:hypothetical protein [bacterium]